MAWELEGAKHRPPIGIHFSEPLRMTERGRVIMGKKGEKRKGKSGNEYRLPVKLNHFELVTTEKDPETDQFLPDKSAVEALAAYSEKHSLPMELDPKGSPVIKELPIMFIRDEIDEVFVTYYALYSGRMWWCRGNGVNDPSHPERNAVRRIRDTKREGRYKEVRWSPGCGWGPCGPTCPEARQDKNPCKAHGILQFAYRFAPEFGGVYTFRTTGINTITGIMAALEHFLTLTGGLLAWVPDIFLTFQKKEVVDRTGKGHRIPLATVIIKKNPDEFINALKSVQQLRLVAQKARLLGYERIQRIGAELTALPPAALGEETEEEIADTVAEFLPGAEDDEAQFEEVEETPEVEADPGSVAEELLMQFGDIDGVVIAYREADEPIPVEPEVLVKVAVELQLLDEKKAEAKLAELLGMEHPEEETVEGTVFSREEKPQPKKAEATPAKDHFICDGCGKKFDLPQRAHFTIEDKTYCSNCAGRPPKPVASSELGPAFYPGDVERLRRESQAETGEPAPASELHCCAACGELVDSADPKGGVIAGMDTLCGKCTKQKESKANGPAQELDDEPGQTGLLDTLPKKKRGRPPKNRLS